MLKTLNQIDRVPCGVASTTSRKQKAALGQFMTPPSIARFMVTLINAKPTRVCRLLDAGAGAGSLTSAFLDRWANEDLGFESVEATAFELDDTLRGQLEHCLAGYAERLPLSANVQAGDFIEHAVNRIEFRQSAAFTHAVLNPPYKKINTGSQHRLLLRQVGIETVNLYSAFVALAVAMMAPGGQIVAIIPRSFCNGPYYRPFREFLLKRAAIRHMHLFESRNSAFKDDKVLQENIIITLECGARQGNVIVSASTDDTFSDYIAHEHPFDRIVAGADTEQFIHVPIGPEPSTLELMGSVRYTLADLGIAVSTGPVVEFRMRDHLREMPDRNCVPLIYPGHFAGQSVEWPKQGLRKPNAIERNADTEKWLYPSGFYAVVRRFSSKEERRRIVASVVSPDRCGGAEALGFENHLNVFHHGRRGLPEEFARGLAVYLNTTAIDRHFRRFNGHTQVNATDLRLMKYPSRADLVALGKWAQDHETLTQEQIDSRVAKLDT